MIHNKTLSSATIPVPSGPGSDGNEGVLRIPQIFSITRIWPSDCLFPYPRHSLGSGVLPLCRKAVGVHYSLSTQPTKQLPILLRIINYRSINWYSWRFFYDAIKRGSVSLWFPVRSHVQVLSWLIPPVYRFKSFIFQFLLRSFCCFYVDIVVTFINLYQINMSWELIFIYCWLFVLILVGFFLCVVSSFTTFRPNFTSGLLQVIFPRPRIGMLSLVTVSPVITEGVRAKNLQATLIFVDFAKAFDSIHRGKMEQILLAYGIPKETVAVITILYRNTKVKVRSPDGDTEYFDIVAGVLQGDTLAPYLFIICLDYVLRTSIDKIRENGFELTKKRSRRYPAKTITDADYADDIAILANTPDQAETLLHRLERAAASIGLYINAHKTVYMCYNQTGDISTLEGTPLKLVDKFTYLGSSVESTEKDIETRLTKAWTAINRLSIIWKSDLTDKMKRSFFQAAVTSILLYGCTTWTLKKRLENKLDGNYTRMLRAILNKSWRQHPTRNQLYGHLPPITKTIRRWEVLVV